MIKAVRNLAAITAAGALLAGCKPKQSEDSRVSELKLPEIPATLSPNGALNASLNALHLQKKFAELAAFGYKLNIANSTLLTPEVSESNRCFNALKALGLAQYVFSDLDEYISGRYQKNFLTSANNYKQEHHTIDLPRFSAQLDRSSDAITLTDNFSQASFKISLPLTETQQKKFFEFSASLPTSIPCLHQASVQETLVFKSSRTPTIWNLPKGVKASLEIYARNASVGANERASGLFSLPLGDLQEGRELVGVHGTIKSIAIQVPVRHSELPSLMRDSFGNVFNFEFIKDASAQDGSGIATIRIYPLLSAARLNEKGSALTTIELRGLKARFSILAEMPDELNVFTAAPKKFDYGGRSFVSLLAQDSESRLDQDGLMNVIRAVEKTEALFGSDKQLVKSVLITDGGISGNDSHFSPFEDREQITISDHCLADLESAARVAQHETIHLIDNYFHISRSDRFLDIAKSAYEQDSDLLDAIKQVGDHPKTSPEELFETLINTALNFDRIKDRLTVDDAKQVMTMLAGVNQLLKDKLPLDAPIIKIIDAVSATQN